MGFNLFSLSGTVSANTTPFDRSMKGVFGTLNGFGKFAARIGQNVDRVFDRLGRTVNGVANGIRSALGGGRGIYGALSAAAGVAGVGLLLRKAVMGASDLGESLSKVQVVFGDSTKSILASADDMASKFGTSKRVFIDAASSLGLIGKASGLAQSDAAKMSDQLARLAIDASSFYNVPIDEALIAMRAGLVGESEPMRRFGVLLSEAAVQNEALALGLANSKKGLTDGAKVQARYSLITKGLADATGDLDRTSGSFSNRLRKLGGQFENLLTSVGTKILPVFVGLAEGLGVLLGQFDKYLDDNGAKLSAWANNVSKAALLVSQVWQQWPKFAQIAGLKVVVAMKQIWEGMKIAGGIAWDWLVYGATNAVTLMVNAFSGLAKYLETLFDSVIKNLIANVQGAMIDLVSGFVGKSPVLMGALFGAQAPAMMALAGAQKPKVTPIAGDASGLTGGALTLGLDKIKKPGGFDQVSGAINMLAGKLPELAAVFGMPVDKLNDKITALTDQLHEAVAKDFIGGMLKSFVKGIGSPLANKSKVTLFNEDTLNRAKQRLLVNPLDRQNEENQRRAAAALKVPFLTGTDKQAQARAEKLLQQRKDRDEKKTAKVNKDAAKVEFGAAGKIGKAAADFVGGAVGKIGGGKFLAGAAGLATAFGLGGLGGLGGALQGKRAGALGGLGAQPEGAFKSSFHGLDEFSKMISSDALSRDKNDPQLGALNRISQGIGTAGSFQNGSVLGVLNQILKKPGGAGFAV